MGREAWQARDSICLIVATAGSLREQVLLARHSWVTDYVYNLGDGNRCETKDIARFYPHH